jgi:large subunit ribosomal protein L3
MTRPGLIAKKIGMTRMVDAEGQMTAVTLLQVEPQRVTKILTPERDGYHGFQVGYYVKAEKHLNKPDVSRLRKANVQDNFTRFKEFRTEAAPEGLEVGSLVDLAKFFDGVKAIDATGITKGRGFAGAHVRWNSAVGRMSHGSRFHRRPGSLGMRATPGKVMKNRHQPGHHGDAQVTIQNLDVLDVDQANSLVAVRGAVPGHRDGFLILAPSIKVKKPKAAQPAKK